MEIFTSKELRHAFGQFMTGVTVVTTVSDAGVPVGFTANSYTSVSLDPPLLLICIAKSLGSYDIFNSCDHFVINVLNEEQKEVSNIFATSTDDRFSQISWEKDRQGCPRINDSLVSFSCSNHEQYDGGDHTILIGKVDDFVLKKAAGLGYCSSGYFSIGMERQLQENIVADESYVVGAIIECDGQILMQRTASGLRLPSETISDRASSLVSVRNLFENAGMDIFLGSIFSIYEDKEKNRHFNYYRGLTESLDDCGLGEFIRIESLNDEKFESTELEELIQRYILERKSGPFIKNKIR